MNKTIKFALTILLITTFLFNLNVFAKNKKQQKSVCSIVTTKNGLSSVLKKGSFKTFSHATGKLILLGKNVADAIKIDSIISPKSINQPGNNSSGGIASSSTSSSTSSSSTGGPDILLNNEAGFYKGNDLSIPSKKIVTLKGTHINSIISLGGTGRSKGYSLIFDAPSGFCVDSKKRKTPLVSSVISLAFQKSSSNEIFNILAQTADTPVITATRRGVTISGKISTGKGEGRFVVKLR